MRYLVMVCLMFCIGCVAFSHSGYTDADGKYHPPERGVVDQVATGLGAASPLVPFAGLAAAILGVVGAAGGVLTHQGRKGDGKQTAMLLNNLKDEIGSLSNRDDVKAFIKRNVDTTTTYGKIVNTGYEFLKKQKAS